MNKKLLCLLCVIILLMCSCNNATDNKDTASVGSVSGESDKKEGLLQPKTIENPDEESLIKDEETEKIDICVTTESSTEVQTEELNIDVVSTEVRTEELITEVKETVELKIGSYNIKHAADGGCDTIGKVISSAGLDICGLQEVDYLNTRSSKQDQVKLIADAAGMPYYRFIRAIDYKGGQYGTAILSKYPIESFTVTALYSGTEEGRSIGKAVIDVNGVKLDFYCTHLSYESTDLRKKQFETLSGLLSESETFILVADFNTEDFSEFSVLGNVYMVNSNEHRYVTFPKSSSAIDNIIMSENLKGQFDSVIEESYSDHYALTAKAFIEK